MPGIWVQCIMCYPGLGAWHLVCSPWHMQGTWIWCICDVSHVIPNLGASVPGLSLWHMLGTWVWHVMHYLKVQVHQCLDFHPGALWVLVQLFLIVDKISFDLVRKKEIQHVYQPLGSCCFFWTARSNGLFSFSLVYTDHVCRTLPGYLYWAQL